MAKRANGRKLFKGPPEARKRAAQFAAADNTAQGVRWGAGLLRARYYPNANASRRASGLASENSLFSIAAHAPTSEAAALRSGDAVRVLSLSSPVAEERVKSGCDELARLGYAPKLDRDEVLAKHGFFAGLGRVAL